MDELNIEQPDDLKTRRRKPSKKKVPENLLADSIVASLEANPGQTMQDAARDLGYSFRDLDANSREVINDKIKKFIKKFWIGDPAMKRAMIESTQIAGLLKCWEKGDMQGALQFINSMMEDPAVALKSNKNVVDLKIDISDLHGTIERASNIDHIIIDVEKEEENGSH